jgi:hypothetical protein
MPEKYLRLFSRLPVQAVAASAIPAGFVANSSAISSKWRPDKATRLLADNPRAPG